MKKDKIIELLNEMLTITNESYEDQMYLGSNENHPLMAYYQGKKDAYETALQIISLYNESEKITK